MNEIPQRLAELEELGLLRDTRLVSGPQGPHVVLDGRPVLLLCSNNYLGLADHPRVREAAADAAMRWGAGTGGSRLVSGTMTVHRRLEERLAEFEHTEATVLFGSGYMANLGVIGTLAGVAGPDPVIFSDELNHASIIDGCRLARGRTVVYDHCDTEHLAALLRQHTTKGTTPIIVTDSVFSMDGDIAPLPDIVRLVRQYGARLVVDEAHATGCLGPDARGVVAEFGLEGQVDVIVGTLGKALGSYGAYAACNAEVAALLHNAARPFIFSTAPGPPQIAAAMAALELIVEQPRRAERLQANAEVLRDELAREGFDVSGGETHIIPIVVGSSGQTVRMCEAALEHGVFAQAIRPPTVPEGTSRLRLAVMASHTRDELRDAARALGRAALQAGFRPADGMPAAAARRARETEPIAPLPVPSRAA
jgi:8-amino-7-oxononanoate synthase